MTDREPEDHKFSEGQGFDDPYDGFDLEPPEFEVDTDKVDPVDSRVVTDMLDRRNIPADAVDPEQLLDVGLEYMHINRHEQAAETFERVAQYTDDERLKQEAWTNKGAAHAELEEWDAAIGAYKEALKDMEGGEAQHASERASGETASTEHAATAETNLAYALWESGRTEQALEHAERAVEIDPRFAQAWYNRGFFLSERGLAEDAVEAFDNAIRLGFRNADVLEEKARALEEMGEYDRAEELADEVEEMRQNAEEQLLE
ncbi:tetratricopeptide repeat protein [Haloarcula marina]|uniref:tetratricopeptide repeat protein n=1 Tax=Haloarcula marina TaxID=2961574 RepID=UPI0020B839A6|nr:tetratricopeptide repeat protein [Halomicroarcula marina]